jgi:hypothetical protein
MTSCDFKAPWCPGNGSFSYGGNGQYTEVLFARDRPKLTGTGTDRAAVSAEAYKGIGQGTVAQFGTWSVDEATKTVTLHPDNTFTRVNEGTDRKVSISITGDELKATIAGPNGGTATWKKSPPLQQVAAAPAAQQQTLKQQIQGAWNLVSCDAKNTFCVNPRGSFGFSGTGRYIIVVTPKDRPKQLTSVGHGRENVTPEEYKTVAQGVGAVFGSYTVNEGTKEITLHAEGSLFPATEGTDIKSTIVSVNADELKLSGDALGNSIWRKFK